MKSVLPYGKYVKQLREFNMFSIVILIFLTPGINKVYHRQSTFTDNLILLF